MGSATGYLRNEAIVRVIKAAVGFMVRTPKGRGLVVGLVNGGDSFDVHLLTGCDGPTVEQFSAVDLDCIGAAALPVVERLSSQASLFLAQSAERLQVGDVYRSHPKKMAQRGETFSFSKFVVQSAPVHF
jgi:hypothetical protein